MRLLLLRPYQTRSKGATLGTVPLPLAKKLIERGIAIEVKEKAKKDKTKDDC